MVGLFLKNASNPCGGGFSPPPNPTIVLAIYGKRYIELLTLEHVMGMYSKYNPFPATQMSTFVITSLSSQNLCKAHFP